MLDLPEVFGKYVLLERIAIGGMAEIFKARAAGLGGFEKLLAIKRLHPRYSEDDDFIRMLVDEAKIAVELSHMNICQIFDLGRHDELVYITMELIEGRDLYRLLKRMNEAGRRIPIEAAIFIAMETLAGLDYAHRKTARDGTPLNIVHRDISPQNVLISWEGEVKLVDFGIAKATSRAFETESGIIKGKFYYMSPEQARGDKTDQRSDIFSAGIVLYELLTGTLLYGEENDLTLLSRVRRADIAPPTNLRPDISPELERIVMKALRRDVRRRYQTAHQFHMALSNLLFSSGRPFGRVQLAQLMREEFGREQAHPHDMDFSIHDRFLSRVEFTEQGRDFDSMLLNVGDNDSTIRVDRDQARAILTHTAPARNHDPYAEGVYQGEGGEFEGAPTSAEARELFFNDDDETNVYLGGSGPAQGKVNATEAQPRLSAAPPWPPPGAPGPPPLPPGPRVAVAPPPSPDRERPRALKDMAQGDGMTSDVITGVYNEPTKVHLLEGGATLAPDDELFEVPLGMRLLFGIGLVFILVTGGTLSAVGMVFAAPDGEEGAEDAAEAEATTPAAKATRLSIVLEPNVQGAMVSIEGREPQVAPAEFKDVEPGAAVRVTTRAPGYQDKVETIGVPGAASHTHTVRLEPMLGALSVTSNPAGARILVDRADSGMVTPSSEIKVPLHVDHTIRVELEGYVSAEQPVAPGTQGKRSFHFDLIAALDPKDDDEEAVAAADKKAADDEDDDEEDEGKAAPPAADRSAPPRDAAPRVASNTPRQAAPAPSARDTEREKRENREKRERERLERERRDAAASRSTPPRGGSTPPDRGGNSGGNAGASRTVAGEVGYVSVSAKPWGQVYVDGRLVAKETPLRNHPLSVGKHTIKVTFPTLPGGRFKSKTVSINRGQTTQILFVP